MVKINLNLMGPPELLVDSQPVPLGNRKSIALLAYLAVTETLHSRDSLAAIFWPDFDQIRARTYLRQAYHSLTKAMGSTDFQADRDTLGMRPNPDLIVDISCFHRHLQAASQIDPKLSSAQALSALEQAIALSRDSFMVGFDIPDSPAYDEWQYYERTSLQREVAGAMLALAYGYGRKGEFQTAIGRAHACLAMDSLDESAHRCLMTLYAWAGRQAESYRQYDRCVQLLRDELGAAPADETTDLMEEIRAHRVRLQAVEPVQEPAGDDVDGEEVFAVHGTIVEANRQSTLPRESPSFVGRTEDIRQICRTLAASECKLLTIVGEGGIGKTQLAIAAAREMTDRFTDGILFVSLAALPSSDMLYSSILSCVGRGIQIGVDPYTQLLGYLNKRQLLLVLDNFEHLIDGADMVRQLLQGAPSVHFLITSRERLNLLEEWTYHLEGLPMPVAEIENDPVTLADLGEVDSVKLFVTLARRTRLDFQLTADNMPSVAQICRYLAGNPLALQLAAAWIRVLSPLEIARELVEDTHLLRGRWRDLPERHQSMQAVIDYSWRLLTERERIVLGQLAVFEPGFSRAAASAVAGADLDTMSALVDKSWVHVTGYGRFEIHDLTRRFVAGLVDDLEEKTQRGSEGEMLRLEDVQRSHCEYYAALLHSMEDHWRGSDEIGALAQIVADWDNLRTAWRWAIDHRNIGALNQMVDSLQWTAEVRGWHREALDAFALAADSLQKQKDAAESTESTYTMVRLRYCQARHTFALGRLREAEAFCRQGMSALDDLSAVHRQQLDATLNLILSRVLSDMRRHSEATVAAETALAIFRKLEDRYSTAWTAYTLGLAIHEDGDNPRASVYFQQAISIGEEIGSQRVVSYGLGIMASILFLQGEYEQALDFSRRSLKIRQRFGDWRGIAYCLQEQGILAAVRGNLPQSEALLRQALAITEDIGEKILQRGIMWCLGAGLYHAGKFDESLRVYRRGLALAMQESDYVAGRAWFQAGLALTLHSLGVQEEAKTNLNSALKTFATVPAPYEAMDALLIAGKILADSGQIERAAQLLGFVEHNPIKFRFLQQQAHDRAAKLALSTAQRRSAANAGKAMSLQEALTFALS